MLFFWEKKKEAACCDNILQRKSPGFTPVTIKRSLAEMYWSLQGPIPGAAAIPQKQAFVFRNQVTFSWLAGQFT